MKKIAHLPTVSVIIPVRQRDANFRKCLSGLKACVPPPREIIIIDDGSKGRRRPVPEGDSIHVLRLKRPAGPARARNLGAKEAIGDILFFVDADVKVPRDSIGRIVRVFQNDSGLSALFGSYDDAPGEANFFSQYKNLFHHYTHQTSSEDAFTFWAGCGAIRRDLFISQGGFDDTYTRPSVEDIELGYRLVQAGHKIRLLKSLKVKHLKRWGFLTLLRSDFFDRAIPWTRLIIRDRYFANDLNLKYSSRISVILAYGVLFTLLGTIIWLPWLFLVAGAFIVLLMAQNAPLYVFFMRKRGLWFTFRALLWHWFYYLYSGMAFFIVLFSYPFARQRVAEKRVSGNHTKTWK